VPEIITFDAEGTPADAVVNVWSLEVARMPSELRISK
jgi:hypothetical protein